MACGRSLGQDGPVRQEFRSAGALAAAGQESLACAGCGKIRWPVIRKTFIIAKWPDPPGHPTLPSRSVLRFRGVCKAWPDLFSDPNFVREHHRLQPDLPLVSFRRNASEELGEVDCRAEALDLHTATSGPSRENSLYVCNPATHQLTCLGTPAYSSNLVAFYRHDLTGEYRALLYRGYGSWKDYSYLLVAGSEGRRIGRLPSEEDGAMGQPQNTGVDTAKEVFRWMRPPPVIREHMPVLEMEGKLAVFSCAEDVRVAEIWHLQDYKNQMWACKYHIELPALDISTLPDLDGGRKSCGGRPQQRLLLSDMNGYLQERFRWDGCLLKITPCTFKESLVRMHSLRHRTM
uniref:F-box associated domain-containing protein n=1 Tax=Setaria italica TaxID=4555 RepID=K4A292_SETIT